MTPAKKPQITSENIDYIQLATDIRRWSAELGFQQAGIAAVHLEEDERHLQNWLKAGYHGEMDYMERHGTRRSRPDELIPGTCRVISLRMDYLPTEDSISEHVLADPDKAYISRYAVGRDYHKLIRRRLQRLAARIAERCGPFGYRAFVDSAPVLEKALARQSGLGWIGKHTNLINHRTGSWFFLGELYTDLPLPTDTPADNHCGNCTRCLDLCPTAAIIAPYQLDARRCISYLTIELKGSIPVSLRPLIGNRVFGCDDCQLVCPWNRFAHVSPESDFQPRHGLEHATLLELFAWSEHQFLQYTEGSAIRRIGFQRWLRNLAVGLGNAPFRQPIIKALGARLDSASPLVREHIQWAIEQQYRKQVS